MTGVDSVAVEHVDEVLATTRAVRRRLDLDRPVDNQLLLDCIDLAEQAPTGGNLGIPDHMTEVVLFPVAWTKGTDFGRAPRHPARTITYFDRFGTTFETGPAGAMRFDDGPGLVVEIDVDARRVWSLVSDIDLPARFSSEFLGAVWEGDERGVAAVFRGRNHHQAIGEWTVSCFVDAYDEGRSFGWRTSDPDTPGARWRFDLEPLDGRTRLRFSFTIGPGASGTTMAIVNHPGKEARVLRRRLDEVHANMQATVAGVKQLAEATP